MTLATRDELEAFADATFTPARAELVLELASWAVQSAARNVSGQIVEIEDDVRLLDGTGTRTLVLPGRPVTAVDKVEIGGTEVSGFTFSTNGVLERTAGVWPKGRRNIEVTYTHGFAPEDIPGEIKVATLQAASRAAMNPGRFNSFSDGQVSVGFGGGGTGTRLLDLLPEERHMVAGAFRQ